MATWHTLECDQVLQQLNTTRNGLSDEEAARRLQEYGPNELERRGGRSPWAVLAGQFTEIMVVVLIVAAGISFFVGEAIDAIMILIIVILNALLGFIQEYRAERAMEALRELAVPIVRVRRNGRIQEIETTKLVPGDIVLLEAGARIPADGRVIESANLRIEEAALTGESVPVDKTAETLWEQNLPIGDRRNMVFMGTTAVYGRGVAVVTETGMRTELGNIADLLQTVEEEKTPLQRRMGELGKWLALGALIVVTIVFAVGVWRGIEWTEMFLTAISLAVAAVPEGLPAVVTIALALGAQRMVRRNALIRKLPAVETLGSVTTICSDKTGTLTENRMTVTMLDVAGQSINLVEELRTTGALLQPGEQQIEMPGPNIALLLAAGALCNDATLEPDEDGAGGYHSVGDPTEGALIVAAARMGLWKAEMERWLPRIAEVPFTSERKRMSTIHRLPPPDDPLPQECIGKIEAECLLTHLPRTPYIVLVKGSVDGLLSVCDRVWDEGTIRPLDAQWRERIEEANNRLAQEGMRVLGAAIRPLEEVPSNIREDTIESELVFVGIVGMIDPPRPEVRQAVAECRTAGIRPVMITGDHPLTALNIARDLGIIQGDADGAGHVLTGQQLAEMSVEELEGVVEEISVYARVSPEHKVKIVEALKDKGHFVAMTGDGVNDAPALKRADIGVAMGITGTDVSKEAADMILLDDNFATIVHAVEEGRTIYDNIRKFVGYIISCNVGEIFLMLMAPLLGLPIPLTPLQLLWINLVTDGLPALALGVEPADPNVMRRPPNPPNESVLARGLGVYMLWVGLLLGLVCLSTEYIAVGVFGMDHALTDKVWRTMVFTTLGLSQMGNALAIRSDRESLFKIGLFSNMPLLGAILLTVALQMAVIYVPFMQTIFDTSALTPGQLGISLALSAIVFIAVELVKLVRRLRQA
ncbi:MAG: cation-translocating P-type ATPase [Chloroflexi bacterium]|nr:cation-translocating P-type ATPase [Chloroflexota bacterium]